MADIYARSAIAFLVQVLAAIYLVIAAIIILSIDDSQYHDLQLVVLARGVGYIFPAPSKA